MRINLTVVSLWVFSSLLFGCAAPSTQRVSVSGAAVKSEERKQMEIVADEVMAEQVRLADVAWLLQTKGSVMCREDVSPLFGMNMMVKPKGEIGGVYARKFGIQERATIFNVAPGSPAELGGIQVGDVLVGINGSKVVAGKPIKDLIGAWVPGKSVQVSVVRKGRPMTFDLDPIDGCNYEIGLSPEQGINAFADGDRVMITRGMMAFAKDDGELALVVSHEIAHNSMKHIDAKKQNMGIGLLVDIAAIVATRG